MLSESGHGRWFNWLGNLGLLFLGVAALVAAAKYTDLMPAIGGSKEANSNWHWMDTATAFAPAVSWLLVILGWWVVSRDHNNRERRKEVRGQIEGLIRDIREIEMKTYDYLPTTADSNVSRSLGLRLKSDLQRLSLALVRLAKVEEIDVKDEMTALRQAITGHEFDSRARQPCDLDSGWALEVQTTANKLIDDLELAFREKYR
jgi:hypothetical protein